MNPMLPAIPTRGLVVLPGAMRVLTVGRPLSMAAIEHALMHGGPIILAVQLDPDKLLNYGISLSQIFRALEENNGNSGGGAIRRGADDHWFSAQFGAVTLLHRRVKGVHIEVENDAGKAGHGCPNGMDNHEWTQMRTNRSACPAMGTWCESVSIRGF